MATERIKELIAVDKLQKKDDFPIFKQKMSGHDLVYLDTASSAQKPQVVIDALKRIPETYYANIHRGLYEFSEKLTQDYENVRGQVARFLKARTDKEIVFTKGTTEAINLVAQSWGRTYLKPDDEILLTEMEHHANIVPWQLLQKEIGFTIKTIPVREDGTLDLERFEALLTHKTKFIGLIHISNALGTINPVKDIIGTAKDFYPDMVILVDGSQSAPHMTVDVQDLDCDFFVFTGHKVYGPTGIGVLYGTQRLLSSMPPYQGGGDMIEKVSFTKTAFKDPPFRFEAGTPPILECIALGQALTYIEGIGFDAIEAHEQTLLRTATVALGDIKSLQIIGRAPQKAGIISFMMDNVHTSDIGSLLSQQGIAVRTGHHCCMPLMQALELDSTVRVSFGVYSDENDIDRLIQGLQKAERMLS